MKIKYRGFEIEATREECMGGYDFLYYTAYRICDYWEMICSFSDCEDTVKDFMDCLKNWVDEYHESPEVYEDEDWLDWFGVELPKDSNEYKVCVCEICARPYICLHDCILHQVDSSGRQSGDYCEKCGGGEK
jgi:hypothetical protein